MPILMGLLEAAVLLTIIWVFWAELSQESSRSGEYTLPVHRPQQHRPVYQPPPCPLPPSQSYRPSPYTPLLHQAEQDRPVYQPPPRPPPPSQSYQSSPYTPPAHQPEQHRLVSQPPPHRPPPSQSYRSSPYTPPAHQPEQHRPISQPPPPPPPSERYQSSPYTSLVHQPEQHQPVSQLPPRPPPPSQSHRSTSYTPPSPHGLPKYEDDNRKDKHNEYYVNLRARANKEGDEMVRCSIESREAFNRGDRAAAKDLSNQGKNHKQKKEQLHKEASDWIYHENNHVSWLHVTFVWDTNSVLQDREPGEIDLHGLYVKEAITYTDAALKEAKLRGDSEIRLIVGKGIHSEGGEAKLGPAIKGRMRKYQLAAEFDPLNSGVLVVGLNGDTPIRHRQRLNISHRRSRRHRRRAGNIGA
ncbi:hypothetical protein EDD85DRAFT_440476 [Armillaria nabsnona]|nr:hypothetical protein EDD85DRAFT_440476 [Armillaria nabsnona]